jgi:hypothetical protein
MNPGASKTPTRREERPGRLMVDRSRVGNSSIVIPGLHDVVLLDVDVDRDPRLHEMPSAGVLLRRIAEADQDLTPAAGLGRAARGLRS